MSQNDLLKEIIKFAAEMVKDKDAKLWDDIKMNVYDLSKEEIYEKATTTNDKYNQELAKFPLKDELMRLIADVVCDKVSSENVDIDADTSTEPIEIFQNSNKNLEYLNKTLVDIHQNFENVKKTLENLEPDDVD